MAGFPGERMDDLADTIRLMMRLRGGARHKMRASRCCSRPLGER